MDYLKEFISKLHSLDKAKRAGEVFKDFLILSMCSLAQPACLAALNGHAAAKLLTSALCRQYASIEVKTLS